MKSKNSFLGKAGNLMGIAFFLLAGLACTKKNADSSVAPIASINNVTQQRSTAASTFHFQVTLNKVSNKDITIAYATSDGSATAGKDYASAAGSITVAAGQLSSSIDVTVTADSLRSANKQFFIQLSNPVNCTLGNNKATGTIVDENGLYFPVANTGYTTPTTYPGYALIWSDEFDGNAINTNNWGFDTGNNGWGNNELENYTNRTQNAFVSQGNLIIEARQEQLNGSNYTSARMLTMGKKSFQFGRIDIRAKLPSGQGIWPALWMLGSNIGQVGWPACGEMDMMELLGQQPNKIYGTLHWGATPSALTSKGSNYTLNAGSFDQQFHVYSMIWKQDSVKLLVDDYQYVAVSATDVAATYPFNNNFFFIFNVAVGGNWPGAPDNTTVFPQRMIVDYIRVFQ
jgi:beta-glucanase (GH16 family)